MCNERRLGDHSAACGPASLGRTLALAASFVLVAALTACSADNSADNEDGSQAPSAAVETASSADDLSADNGDGPQVPSTAVEASPSVDDAFVELEEESGASQDIRPMTLRERNDATAECIRQWGIEVFPGNPNEPPSSKVDNTLFGPDRTLEIILDCQDRYPDISPPSTVESATEFYYRQLAWFNCMADAGMITAPPPSLETVVDQMLRLGGSDFDPTGMAIAEGTPFDAAVRACPWPDFFE